jgi:hypothetical protein
LDHDQYKLARNLSILILTISQAGSQSACGKHQRIIMKKIILIAMGMILVTALAAGLFIILRQAWAGAQAGASGNPLM